MKNKSDATEPFAPVNGSGPVEHTPAPWKASQGHEDDPQRWCVVADKEKQWLIAVIENGQPGDFCETEGATARLIAAAPELLEACKAARHELYQSVTTPEELVALRDKLCTAIAKAYGQNADVSDRQPERNDDKSR